MSYNTKNGERAYSLADLERFATMGSFGQLNGAVAGLIQRTKQLEKENTQLRAIAQQVETYKYQLVELIKEKNLNK